MIESSFSSPTQTLKAGRPSPPLNSQAIRILPVDILAPFDATEIFGRSAPLEIDVGCGDGGFLVAAAQKSPETNFLGIERLLKRVRKCCDRAARAGLTNTRILRLEIGYFFRFMLPPGSVRVIHVLFPDPWPKRRQQQNRLLQAAFLGDAALALEDGGEIRFKTDHAEYFEFAKRQVEATGLFRVEDWPGAELPPHTEFERRFLTKGMPVNHARWKKVGNHSSDVSELR